MALKKKIADITTVDEKYRDQYNKVGDEWVLDLEGEEDTAGLKKALGTERAARETAERQLREVGIESARLKGDIPALEASWQTKVNEALAAGETAAKTLTSALKKATVESTARALAVELGGDSAAVLLPHLTPRLAFELIEGTAVTRVRDREGKPSALTLDDLKKEFREDSAFASVITGSRASGAGGGSAGEKSSGRSGTGEQPNLNDMTPKQLAEHIKNSQSQA